MNPIAWLARGVLSWLFRRTAAPSATAIDQSRRARRCLTCRLSDHVLKDIGLGDD